MRIRKLSVALAALNVALPSALLSSEAKADQTNMETVVTFNQPVAVPGHVLPAGTNDFSLASSTAEHRIVEIRYKDSMRLVAVVMTRPV